METRADATQLPPLRRFAPDEVARRRAQHKSTRPQFLTRSQLDGRTNAAKFFDKLIVDIENDLGGHEQLSTIECALVEAFAGAALTLHHLNAKLALGEAIDLSQHAQAVSAMVRVASRLGLQRRQKDVGLTLDQYLRQHYPAAPAEDDSDSRPSTETADAETRVHEPPEAAGEPPGGGEGEE